MITPRHALLAIALAVGCTKASPPAEREASRNDGGARPTHEADAPRDHDAPEQQARADAPRDAPEERGEPEGPVAPADDPRFSCATPDDCTQTCALGAVNTAWLRAHPGADTCDDGCNWKHDAVTCKDGSCVTLSDDGEVDPGCTHVTDPRR